MALFAVGFGIFIIITVWDAVVHNRREKEKIAEEERKEKEKIAEEERKEKEKERKEKEAKIRELQGCISDLMSVFVKQKNTMKAHMEIQKSNIIDVLRESFSYAYSLDGMTSMHYEKVSEQLSGILTDAVNCHESTLIEMRKTINEMRKYDQELTACYGVTVQSAAIDKAEQYAGKVNVPKIIAQEKRKKDTFKAFGEMVMAVPKSLIMDPTNYGKVNKKFWAAVCGLKRSDAKNYIAHCHALLDSTSFDEIYALDIEKILQCVWFFATEKTYSAIDAKDAERVFRRIYKADHADLILADWYAKKKMGGEEVLREDIREFLKTKPGVQTLTPIASGLMWMNAYQSENAILQHMLSSGMEMTAKAQERLHSLTNSGGKAPESHDVKAKQGEIYVDLSALAWQKEDYIGLFETLSFQDKPLSYALAVREENKELLVDKSIAMPTSGGLLTGIREVFAEEYDTSVSAGAVDCIALSGSDTERLDCVLVSAKDCRQLGILVYITKVGKKLIIKFYTLFIPTGTDIASQKQQALSMHRKLSPSVTTWESSLKDTVLMAVQQLLNQQSSIAKTMTEETTVF